MTETNQKLIDLKLQMAAARYNATVAVDLWQESEFWKKCPQEAALLAEYGYLRANTHANVLTEVGEAYAALGRKMWAAKVEDGGMSPNDFLQEHYDETQAMFALENIEPLPTDEPAPEVVAGTAAERMQKYDETVAEIEQATRDSRAILDAWVNERKEGR